MAATPRELLQQMTASRFSHADRAVALLWLKARDGIEEAVPAADLAAAIEGAGYGQQNTTRLGRQLDGDPRVVKYGDGYRLKITAKADLDRELLDLVGPTLPPPSDSVLPIDLFFDTRGYIERVVHQVNAAYDNALFDCCTVMLRRLFETLIIEVYEQEKREAEIRGADGNYYFLSKLVTIIKADRIVSLSRNTQTALESAKRLGDLSAHNRRYNAVRQDIDRIRDDLRVAAQELLVLSKLRR